MSCKAEKLLEVVPIVAKDGKGQETARDFDFRLVLNNPVAVVF